MLKIPKGLKKKKKGKKSKRKGEEELFTEEELEKYRREHQAQPQPTETQQDSDQESTGKPKTENDEWSKFNALTTGVDSILKKTQGDLDRIKSTSFFQRIPSGPKSVDQCGKNLPLKRDAQKDGQRWIGFEEQKQNGEKSQESHVEVSKAEEPPQVSELALTESESEEEDFDDIFDTSYVEAVEKGEVKLAYIPDSPDEVEEEGPDPFDTSYADKVIKGPEVSKKGKKLVNIGVAVEVLTGRLDNVSPSNASIKRAKRRIPRDLLLETAESDDVIDVPTETEYVSNTKSLLDDDSEILEDVPVDLSVSLHTQFIQKSTEDINKTDEKNDILSTFDTLKDDDDDEFAQIATESLSKPLTENTVIPVLPSEFPIVDDCSWAEFEDSKPKPARPPPPRPSSGPTPIKPEVSSSVLHDLGSPTEFDEGPDPFDTTFAENILPGKAELKSIEQELLYSNTTELHNSDSDFDFNPREDERDYINNRRKSSVHIHVTDPTGIRESISDFEPGGGEFDTLKPVHRDLLGGSSTDLSQLADSPIAPSTATDVDNLDYSDPFDTSIVNFITAPGKTELKFIENELLGNSEDPIQRTLSDPDFDPRAEEIEEQYKPSRKPSRPENLLVNKTVIFKISDGSDSLDLEKGNKKKPLTPYYAREASITDEEVDTLEDTFDTFNSADNGLQAKPVGSILKKGQHAVHLTRSSSDQDLNDEEDTFNEKSFSQLRRHSDFPLNFSQSIKLSDKLQHNKTDFLSISEEESVDTKVLTPYQESRESVDLENDPFDTSIVSNILLPGKTELKVLESELLSKESGSNNLFDQDFNPRFEENKNKQIQDLLEPSDDVFQVKALTPEIPEPATGFLIGTEDDDIDPFDTSIADNLGPGKTELKILESELMN